MTAEIQFSPFQGPSVRGLLWADRHGTRRLLRASDHDACCPVAAASLRGLIEDASADCDSLRASRRCRMHYGAELDVVYTATGLLIAEPIGLPVGRLDFLLGDPASGLWARASVASGVSAASGRADSLLVREWRDVACFFQAHGIGLAVGHPEIPQLAWRHLLSATSDE